MGAMELEEKTVQIRDDFDPDKILESGQCFRPRKQAEGWYRFVSGGQLLYLRPLRSGTYTVRCEPGAWDTFWHGYFDLGRSYAALRGKLDSRDDFLQRAMEYGRGIRVLRQDRWEALCSFIISQNNNIPRIKKLVAALCKQFGERRQLAGHEFYTFPTWERLAGQDLSSLGLGYRDKYVEQLAQNVTDGRIDLHELTGMETEQARTYLKSIHGVGNKVADCVLLFGLHRVEAFPVDTWIRQVIDEHYGGKFPVEHYDGHAGIIQQFIFYYMQQHKGGKTT